MIWIGRLSARTQVYQRLRATSDSLAESYAVASCGTIVVFPNLKTTFGL